MVSVAFITHPWKVIFFIGIKRVDAYLVTAVVHAQLGGERDTGDEEEESV